MGEYRNQRNISIGSEPPQSVWTLVRGDTASFKMYVQDDTGTPLTIEDWNISMDFYRPSTDTVVLTINPTAALGDAPGEFTVSLAYTETEILQTNDEFDIQMATLSNSIVWTVLQGKVSMVEDITD